MPLLFLYVISTLFFLSPKTILSQDSDNVHVIRNKKGTKVWLADSSGARISNKYYSIRQLRNNQISNETGIQYYRFQRKKSTWKYQGVLRSDGSIVINDTCDGNFTLLNEGHLSYEDASGKSWVYNTDGTIDAAYSENFFYSEDGVIIKMKDELYAAYTLYNEPLTDFIYVDYDTSDFRDRNPPVLVYMETPDGEIHRIGLDGKVIED